MARAPDRDRVGRQSEAQRLVQVVQQIRSHECGRPAPAEEALRDTRNRSRPVAECGCALWSGTTPVETLRAHDPARSSEKTRPVVSPARACGAADLVGGAASLSAPAAFLTE